MNTTVEIFDIITAVLSRTTLGTKLRDRPCRSPPSAAGASALPRRAAYWPVWMRFCPMPGTDLTVAAAGSAHSLGSRGSLLYGPSSCASQLYSDEEFGFAANGTLQLGLW